MPMPVSQIDTAAHAPSRESATVMFPSRSVYFRRVVDEVGEDLAHADRIGVDHEALAAIDKRHAVSRIVDRRAVVLDGVADRGGEVDRRLAQLDRPAVDARQLEEVVDQAHEVRGLTLEHFVHASRGLAVGRHAQDLQAVAQRRKRIAELVGERRQELVLAPVGLAQRFLGFLASRDFGLERLRPLLPEA
jgi:hypothetical protein